MDIHRKSIHLKNAKKMEKKLILKRKALPLVLSILIVALFQFCQQKNADEKEFENSIYKTKNLKQAIQPLLQEIKEKGDSVLVIKNDSLLSFIFFKELIKTNGTLHFTTQGKLNENGDSLYRLLKQSRYYGLYNKDYHILKIDSLLPFLFNTKDNTYNAYNIACLELLMLDGYFKMAAHANKGRFNPETFETEWNPGKLDSNWVEIARSGYQKNNFRSAIEQLQPKHRDYLLLLSEFRNYIEKNKNYDWDSIKVSEIKDSTKLPLRIIERLKAMGDYDTIPAESPSNFYKKCLIAFQNKHNLKPDGKLGRNTVQLLKQSKEASIRMMEMSLERWRWEKSILPEKYFWINIPSAELKILEKDKNGKDTLVLFSNVVLGKPESQTPQLSSSINYMTIYPYWNVPSSIAVHEILPKVKKDTSYLRKKNFEILNAKGIILNVSEINWKKISGDNINFRFRQRIGADNSLGIMVFNFPNPHSVYLHDTNSKSYFKSANRFQSHGCIRLEKYVETAKFLIREDTLKIPYDTLDYYLTTSVQRKIAIKKKVPIYLRYYTHVVDSTVGLLRYADIYEKDKALLEKIYK